MTPNQRGGGASGEGGAGRAGGGARLQRLLPGLNREGGPVPGRQGGRCRVGGEPFTAPLTSAGRGGGGVRLQRKLRPRSSGRCPGRGWGRSGRRGQQGRGSRVGKESGEPEATPCSRLQRARPAVAEEPPAPDSCPPGPSPQPRLPPSPRPWAALGPGSAPVLPGTGVPRLPPEREGCRAEGSWGWRTSALGPRGPSETSARVLSLAQAEGPGPTQQQDRAAFSLTVPSPPS